MIRNDGEFGTDLVLMNSSEPTKKQLLLYNVLASNAAT